MTITVKAAKRINASKFSSFSSDIRKAKNPKSYKTTQAIRMAIKNKGKSELAERFITATPMTTSKDVRKRLMSEEGYDPVYMYEALRKTPTPTPEERLRRAKKAEQFVKQATDAPFLDKFRLAER